MPRLFISHSSKDNIAALAFQRWLMGKGWGEDDVFIDLHDMQAGEKWREAVSDHCRCSRYEDSARVGGKLPAHRLAAAADQGASLVPRARVRGESLWSRARRAQTHARGHRCDRPASRPDGRNARYRRLRESAGFSF